MPLITAFCLFYSLPFIFFSEKIGPKTLDTACITFPLSFMSKQPVMALAPGERPVLFFSVFLPFFSWGWEGGTVSRSLEENGK